MCNMPYSRKPNHKFMLTLAHDQVPLINSIQGIIM